MKKGRRLIALFFVAFFFVALADPALARKSHSAAPAKKAAKKHHTSIAKKKVPGTRASRQTATRANKAYRIVGKKRVVARTNGLKKAESGEPGLLNQDTAVNDDEYIRYRVRRGETLDRVAERFNIDKDEIVDLNQFKRKGLRPGSVVLIPKTNDGLDGEAPVILNDRPLSPWKNAEEQGTLVKVAKSFSGAPYKYGGDTVRGLDCSAFVKKMYEIFEVQLPRSAREQYCAGPKVDRDDLITGDLVFFKTQRLAKYPTHVGIYIGDDKFIHASSLLSRGVKIDRLSDGYFSGTYTGAVRVKAPPSPNKSETEQNTNRSGGNF